MSVTGQGLSHDIQHISPSFVVDGARPWLPGNASARLSHGPRWPPCHHRLWVSPWLPVHRGVEFSHSDPVGSTYLTHTLRQIITHFLLHSFGFITTSHTHTAKIFYVKITMLCFTLLTLNLLLIHFLWNTRQILLSQQWLSLYNNCLISDHLLSNSSLASCMPATWAKSSRMTRTVVSAFVFS